MGTTERKDRERQAVRDAILDAARDLFVGEGYRNVSLRKIAQRIEYSPAAIYSYFEGKDDIFYALAEEGFRHLSAKVRAAVGQQDPLEEIRAGWWAFYEFSKEQRELFDLMFVDRSVPKITDQWEGFEVLQQLLAASVASLQRGIDAGALPATLDPHVAMHVLWGALLGPSVIGTCHRLAPGEDCDALARDVLESTLAGFRAGVKLSFVPCESVQKRGDTAHLGERRHES